MSKPKTMTLGELMVVMQATEVDRCIVAFDHCEPHFVLVMMRHTEDAVREVAPVITEMVNASTPFGHRFFPSHDVPLLDLAEQLKENNVDWCNLFVDRDGNPFVSGYFGIGEKVALVTSLISKHRHAFVAKKAP